VLVSNGLQQSTFTLSVILEYQCSDVAVVLTLYSRQVWCLRELASNTHCVDALMHFTLLAMTLVVHGILLEK
jgi:hypothetical protein